LREETNSFQKYYQKEPIMNRQRWPLKIWKLFLDFLCGVVGVLAFFISIVYPLNEKKQANCLVVLKRATSLFLAFLGFITVIWSVQILKLQDYLGEGLAGLIVMYLPFLVMSLVLIFTMKIFEDMYKLRATPIAKVIHSGKLNAIGEAVWADCLEDYLKGIESDEQPVELHGGYFVTTEKGFVVNIELLIVE
jgi:hypothetical protein